jgi:hypothetical protein
MMAFKDGIREIVKLSAALSLANIALPMRLSAVKAALDDRL